MNRLAQALVCLTDPTAKQHYDTALGLAVADKAGAPLPAGRNRVPPAPQPPVSEETKVPTRTQLDWSATPPPVRVATAPEAATPVAQHSPASSAPTVAAAPSADPGREAVRAARAARRGLGTRGALYRRLQDTRRMLRAWDQAGKYLARARGRLTRPAEAAELTRRLARLDALLVAFPPLIGDAGQPGYRVVALARDENVVHMFKAMSDTEREALAQDWSLGRAVLLAHQRYVRQLARSVRRQGWLQRALRALQVAINDHPAWILVLVAVAFLLFGITLWSRL
jgi:hypothetical protein